MQRRTNVETSDVWPRRTLWPMAALATLGAVALTSWRLAQLRHRTRLTHTVEAVHASHVSTSNANNTEGKEASGTSSEAQHAPVVSSVIVAATAPLTESDPCENSSSGSGSEDSSTQRIRRLAHIAQPVHEYEKRGLPGGAHGWRRVYGLLQASIRSISDDTDSNSSSNTGSTHHDMAKASKLDKDASESHAGVSATRFSVWPVQGYRKILPDVSSLQQPVTELDVQDVSYMAKEEHMTEEGQQYSNWHTRVYGALVRHFSGLVALSQRVLTRGKANTAQTNETSTEHSARHRGSTVQSRPVRRVTSVVRSVNEPNRLDMRRKGKSLTAAAEASQQLPKEDEEVDVQQQQQQERTLQDQISYLVHATHLARQEMETELVTMREPVETIGPIASNVESGTHSVTTAVNTHVDATSTPVLQDKSAGVDVTSGPCTALPMPPCAVARMLLTVPPSPVLTAAEYTPLRQAGEAISSSVTTSSSATVNATLPAASNANTTTTTPDTSHKLTISQLWHLLETRRQLQMAHTRALQAGIGEGRDPAQLVQRYRAHRNEHNGYGQVLSDLTTEMRLRRVSTRSRAKAALTDNQASMRHAAMQRDRADDRTHIEDEDKEKTRVSRRPHNQRRNAPHDSKNVEDEDNGEYGDVDEDERVDADDTGVDRAPVVAMLSPRWSLVEGTNEESKYKRSISNRRHNTNGTRGRSRHNTNTSLQSRTSSANSSNAAPLVPSSTAISTNTMMMMQSAPLPMTTRSRHDSMHSARHSSLTTTTSTSSSSSTAPSSSCTSGSIATSHASSCCTSASQQQQQQQQQRMQERRRDDLTVKNTDGGAYYSLSVTYHDSLTGASRTVDAKSLPPLSVEGQSAASPLPIHSVSSRRVSGEVVQAAVAAPSQVSEGRHSHISPAAGLVTSHTTHLHSEEMHNNDEDTEEGAVTVKRGMETTTVSSVTMHGGSSEHNASSHYIEVPTTTSSTHNPHELRQMSLLTATQTSSSVLTQHNNTTTTGNVNSAAVATVPKVAVFAAPLPAYEPMDGPQLQGVAGRRGEMRIGAFLGGGACGKVYECLNTETGQILAAKQIVFDAKDTKLRQRLKQLELELEVLTLATRHHAPWIVGFHGAEKRGHSVLMYLEYCAHSSLLDFMAEGNGSEAARWGMASSSVPLAPHPSMQSYSIGTGGASLCHMLCNGLEYPSKERTTPPILPIVYDKADTHGSNSVQEGVAAKSLNEHTEDEEGAAVCDMSAGGGAGKRHHHYRSHSTQNANVTNARSDTSSNAAAAIAECYRANEEAAALQPVTALSLQSHVECVELQFSPGSSTAHPSLSRASSMSFTAQCSFTSSSTLTTTTTTTSYTQTHNTSSNEETSNSGSEGSASVHSVALTMTLSEAMHPQVPPLSIAQVQRFTRQTVEGLHFLHTSGYAHLDVKTANILITADEECRLADLGCAMRLKPADPITTTNSKRTDGDSSYRLLQEHESITELRGTALYMAPEMIRFERTRIGSAADIWSLGCVVMEIATGCAPWRHVAKDKLHVLFRVGSARHELPLPPLLQAWMAEAKEWLAQWGEEAYPDGEKKEEHSGRSDAAADTRRMTNEKEEGKRSIRSSTSDSTKEGEAAGKRGANVESIIQPPRQRTRLEGERWGPGAQRVSTTTDAANPVEEDEEAAAAQTAPPVCENDAAYMAQQRRLMHMYIELVDFVNCCLRIRPEARSTTTQLLQHPFLNL